jgi:hypothetical protein
MPLVKIIFSTASKQCKSSQVKLKITNNAFCIVQRATAQAKIGFFRDCGVAEAPPGFQAGWSDCTFFFLSFCSFCLLIWSLRLNFLLMRVHCRTVSKLSPGVLSGGGRCLFRSTRRFRTANGTPLHLPPISHVLP